MRNPKEIVREGYDKVSFAYREDEPDKSGESYLQYKSWVDQLSDQLEAGCSILDLGCGCGVPTTQLLAQQFRVTGADISPVQIERAKKLVPDATFICGDMCKLDFVFEEFDAIVCLYAIIHVPVAEQEELLARIWTWLKPKGYLLLIAGQNEWTGKEVNWLGVDGGNMYWSHTNRDTYIEWLEKAGFTIVWKQFVPEGNGGHALMLARKNEKH